MTKLSKKGSKFLVIFSFIITFALCITLADFFSNLITIKAFNNVTTSTKTSSYSIYAVSLHQATTKTTALEYSSTIQKQSGAGYVWQSGEVFYVLASAYTEENDANLVKTNLEGSGFSPTILKIDVNEVTLSGTFSSSEQTALNNSISAYKTTYSKLYDISVSLDTSVKTESECKIQIADIESDLNKVKLNFDALFDSKLTTSILYIKLTLTSLCDEIETLVGFEGTTTQTFSSKIKETYLEAISLNISLSGKVD